MSTEYQNASDTMNAVTRIFRAAQLQYRAGQITTDEYLHARNVYTQAEAAFDEAYSRAQTEGHQGE